MAEEEGDGRTTGHGGRTGDGDERAVAFAEYTHASEEGERERE